MISNLQDHKHKENKHTIMMLVVLVEGLIRMSNNQLSCKASGLQRGHRLLWQINSQMDIPNLKPLFLETHPKTSMSHLVSISQVTSSKNTPYHIYLVVLPILLPSPTPNSQLPSSAIKCLSPSSFRVAKLMSSKGTKVQPLPQGQ
jgi:hypothetical protein